MTKIINKETQKTDNKNLETLAQLENYLSSRYKFFLNEIKGRVEYTPFLPLQGPVLKEANYLDLLREVRAAGIWVSEKMLEEVLGSDFSERYNPLKFYFEGLCPLKSDGIAEYLSFVRLFDNAEYERLYMVFKKWAVAAVKCVYEPRFFNKRCIVFTGKRDTYKTSFFRHLLPKKLSGYIKENPFLLNDSKDSRFALARNFLILLDEFDQYTPKLNWSCLKSYMTTEMVNDRRPFARHEIEVPRISSFLGTSNQLSPLRDETGTARFILFRVEEKIDPIYREFDIDRFWATAYKFYLEGVDCELTDVELEKNEEANKEFMHQSSEYESLMEFFEPSDSDKGTFLTASEILAELRRENQELSLSPVHLGRALRQGNFERVGKSGRYGYYVSRKLIN